MDAMGAACYRARSTAISHPTPIVFVVDDELAIRESLERLIRSASWEPRTFGSAQEFLARPRARAPGCLILDVDLPDLNGLELQQRIAADRVGDADHIHHRPFRRAHVRQGDEGRRHRVPAQTVRR